QVLNVMQPLAARHWTIVAIDSQNAAPWQTSHLKFSVTIGPTLDARARQHWVSVEFRQRLDMWVIGPGEILKTCIRSLPSGLVGNFPADPNPAVEPGIELYWLQSGAGRHFEITHEIRLILWWFDDDPIPVPFRHAV